MTFDAHAMLSIHASSGMSSSCEPASARVCAALLGCCLLVALAVTGCIKARSLAPVRGQVTYQGKPLRFGIVMFQPEYGKPALGRIQGDGTFHMAVDGEGNGAVVGMNRVRIACFQGQDADAMRVEDTERSQGRSLIPKKYSLYDTSGITVDVRPHTNGPVVLELMDP